MAVTAVFSRVTLVIVYRCIASVLQFVAYSDLTPSSVEECYVVRCALVHTPEKIGKRRCHHGEAKMKMRTQTTLPPLCRGERFEDGLCGFV
jgi:hypothetical protein